MIRVLQVISFLIVFISCTSNACKEHPDVTISEVRVQRLEHDFHTLKSKEEIRNYLAARPDLFNGFLLAAQYPDSFVVNYLYQVNNSSGSDTIYNECELTYGDFSAWKEQFSKAQSLLMHYYPEEKSRTIYTFIPGLTRDLYVNDSSMYLGIDYFLGSKATFKPQNHQYILDRYTPQSLVPMSMLYISGKYNATDRLDHTLLADMIYFGKSFYFCKSTVPCVADSTIIGFTNEQWEESEEHSERIWNHFVGQKLLFVTNEQEKQRYVGERPSVSEIGNKCPGRIGQWLGWKIVNAYMENHPEVTLADLMANQNAKEIFELSKFRP